MPPAWEVWQHVNSDTAPDCSKSEWGHKKNISVSDPRVRLLFRYLIKYANRVHVLPFVLVLVELGMNFPSPSEGIH